MAVKLCRVSFTDADRIEHAVEVEANSLYEAVGRAIARFRDCGHLPYQPEGLHRFVVEPRSLTEQHVITRPQFEEWLARPHGSPRDVFLRSKLRELLGRK
jgi:hypothetical protein